MSTYEPQVREFMTLQPQTIQSKENVEMAAAIMLKLGVRHLPVLKNEVLVGILSEREVNLANGIESIDPKHLLAIDVCSEKPYIVYPDASLREVVGIMARKHFGSAVVMENEKVVGIFTTVDACRALHDLLEEALEEENLAKIRHFRFFLRCVAFRGR